MSIDRLRHGRQIRLPEVGESGQERLTTTETILRGEGFAREIEETYLRVAGANVVHRSGTPGPRAAEDAKRISARALGLKHPSARELGDGALHALMTLRDVLGVGAAPPKQDT